MIERTTTSAVQLHVLKQGDSIGASGQTVSAPWAVAFLTDGYDGILIEGDHSLDVLDLVREADRTMVARCGNDGRDLEHLDAGDTDPEWEMALRGQRHRDLVECWDRGQPAWWNHDKRADLLLDWATDPVTPDRDASIYAALAAGERQASWLGRQDDTLERVADAQDSMASELEGTCGVQREGLDNIVEAIAPAPRRGMLDVMAGWFR